MKRREFLATSLAAGVVALHPRALRADAPQEQPNILYIMSDDHSSRALGSYASLLSKYAPTKNIDRIRNEGALLNNCFCTNSICVPSRASILTGQYSHVNGIKTLHDSLKPEADNVAKRLKGAGYATAIVGKWHLGEQPSGFDYYNVLRRQGRYNDPVLFETGKDWKDGGRTHKGHSTDVITDQALAWLKKESQKKEKPFCMMVHFKAVHAPFHSADRFRSFLKDTELPEPEDLLWPESPKGKVFGGHPLERLAELYHNRPEKFPPPALNAKHLKGSALRKATYQKYIKDYLRTVAGIDENVGRLLDYLDKTGQSRNTIVIYTSDQGFFLGEHNLYDKRFFLEESIRMPFLIRYPKEIRPGTTVDDMTLNVDFPELLLDYAGVSIPETMQGRSFRRNLQGHTPPDWRTAMYYRYYAHSKMRPSHYGVRTHTHKLIYYDGLLNPVDKKGKKGTKNAQARNPNQLWELYDLKKDPFERRNCYRDAAYGAVITDLRRELKRVREECGDTSSPTISLPPR